MKEGSAAGRIREGARFQPQGESCRLRVSSARKEKSASSVLREKKRGENVELEPVFQAFADRFRMVLAEDEKKSDKGALSLGRKAMLRSLLKGPRAAGASERPDVGTR